jgi:hypothetical protein
VEVRRAAPASDNLPRGCTGAREYLKRHSEAVRHAEGDSLAQRVSPGGHEEGGGGGGGGHEVGTGRAIWVQVCPAPVRGTGFDEIGCRGGSPPCRSSSGDHGSAAGVAGHARSRRSRVVEGHPDARAVAADARDPTAGSRSLTYRRCRAQRARSLEFEYASPIRGSAQ